MFEETSRYTDCNDLTITVKKPQLKTISNGKGGSGGGIWDSEFEIEEQEIRYKERRFIPPADKMKTLQEVTYTTGDRLDLITARTLGDPEQFWRVCDANEVMHPLELTSDPGNVIRIAIPWN